MIKKSQVIILFMLIIIIFFSLNTAAYYQTDSYRKSLLEIRDAERALNNLNNKLNEAKTTFRIIDHKTVDIEIEKLQKLYQRQVKSYQNKEDQKAAEIGAQIIKAAEQTRLKLIESKPVQLRAFWLDSGSFAKLKNRDGIKKLLNLAEKANFNLIFPEVFYKGMTVIPSNELFEQDPRFSDWEKDPLKILIEEAKKRKIEVHPWLWVFNENTMGKKGRILTKYPEWANKDKKGNIVSFHNSTWLSPAREDVKRYLQKRYQYLVKNYDLDGINLDYIRFPEEYRGSFGYDKKTTARFKKEYDIDPFNIKEGSNNLSVWNKYRENLITEMVAEISKQLKGIDPDLIISADVIPGRNEAKYRALQDWFYWLENDLIDFAVPMTYTENLFSELSRWIKKDRDLINKAIYPGISIFKLTSDQVIAQVEEVNQINPNGMSLFAAAHLSEKNYNLLSLGVFSQAAILPYKNKSASLAVMQDFILKRLNIIKEAEKIKNENLIKIRAFLNKSVNNELEAETVFTDFLIENNILLSKNVEEVLKADFDYLEDIKRLY